MASGRALMCTVPFAAASEVWNDPVAALLDPAESLGELLHEATSRPSPPQTASSLRCERLVMLVILHRVAEDEVRPLRHPTVVSNEPPFLRGQVSLMEVRRPGSSPERASPLRDSAGISPASLGLHHSGRETEATVR